MFQVLYEADGRHQVFTVLKDVLSIGRANDNDIVLNDFSVSRRHAYLKKEDGAWVIHDNQSTNGVRVNDQAVPAATVKDGDSVVIGTFVLRFRDDPTVSRHDSRRVVDATSTLHPPDRRVQRGLRPREERRAARRRIRPPSASAWCSTSPTRTRSSRSSSRWPRR